ncbi:MAG: type III PLP-dependent enzyme [Desulforhabdus sp.]|nr:type III PLP-dependent enzyme [Desulforhabdus sp.]
MHKQSSYETPYLLIDLDKIRQQCRLLRQLMEYADIYYAVKANPARRIVQTAFEEHCGLEISSETELQQAIELGVPPNRIISSNPVKKPSFISALHDYGVDRLAFDSKVEVDKIKHCAPKSRLYLRLRIDNAGSDWPLSGKFGVDGSEAISLLSYAAAQGLTPYGLTFHVGSQCLNIENWEKALLLCSRIIEQVADRLPLEMVNLGGGLPIQHTKPIPQLADIVSVIAHARNELFGNHVTFLIEPGRFLVGEAATLATTVVGKAQRGSENWLYLDAGVFNGLMETVERFSYDFEFDVDESREKKVFTIAGPTCDSLDTMFVGRLIPDLEVGDKLYVKHAGAYTNAYASHFNGFAPPTVLYTDCLFHTEVTSGNSGSGSPSTRAKRLPLEC